MSAPVESTVCEICRRPVKIVAVPGQRHRHLANHGKVIGQLCAGSGKPAPKGAK